jgi:hypothetical protein
MPMQPVQLEQQLQQSSSPQWQCTLPLLSYFSTNKAGNVCFSG